MDIKEYKRQWYLKNKEKLKEASKENYHNNKERYKEHNNKWRELNRAHFKEYQFNWRNDGYYSVYLLPNENYVGQTKGVKKRISQHKTDGKDTSDYKILHTFETRKEAIAKEAEYHSNGYNGKHTNRWGVIVNSKNIFF